MIGRRILPILLLFPRLVGLSAQEAAKSPLSDHLRYVGLLERGESALERKDAEAVLRIGRQALEAAIPECRIPAMKLDRKGAAAHFLLACGASLKGRMDEAWLHLGKAAENGYSDVGRVRSEKALSLVRRHPEFSSLEVRFQANGKSDAFAGKTVKDRNFGMGLIHARKDRFPKVGERAPDFNLELFGQGGKLCLSSFQGKSPVVLVFGSYT